MDFADISVAASERAACPAVSRADERVEHVPVVLHGADVSPGNVRQSVAIRGGSARTCACR
jgi:hypothetical protein